MRLIALVLSVLVAGAGEEALRQVRERVRDAPVVRGEFTQTRELVGVPRPLQSSGRFVVDRGRGVLWLTDAPFPGILRVGAGEIVQFDGGVEIMRLDSDREPGVRIVGQVLRDLFAGDVGALGTHFDAVTVLEEHAWRVELVPRDPGLVAMISGLTLTGGSAVESITLTAAGGDVTRIEFRNVGHAEALEPAEASAFE